MVNKKLSELQYIGDQIKTNRKAQGLSQDDLAGISGTGRRVISELENGKTSVSVGKLLSILDSLGMIFLVTRKWTDKPDQNLFPDEIGDPDKDLIFDEDVNLDDLDI